METTLKNRVYRALQENPHFRTSGMNFEAEAGRVILRGSVFSWYQKQMAQEALLGVEGIAEIQNELRVVPRRENRLNGRY